MDHLEYCTLSPEPGPSVTSCLFLARNFVSLRFAFYAGPLFRKSVEVLNGISNNVAK